MENEEKKITNPAPPATPEKPKKQDKLDQEMNAQLREKERILAARNDETGDGKVDIQDLKTQLNRIEAQLSLQDGQNRKIMRNQKLRLILTCVLSVLLAVVVGILWYRTNLAYDNILASCEQVNQIAARLNDSLATLETEELNQLMHDLPIVTDQIKAIDVDALNEVLTRLPTVMDTVAQLQTQINGIAEMFNGLSSLGGLGNLLGMATGG